MTMYELVNLLETSEHTLLDLENKLHFKKAFEN